MKKKNKGKRIFVYVFVFLIGLGIFLYPTISRFYYRIEFKNEVNEFSAAAANLSDEEVKERIRLARGYNKTLDPSRLSDPYSEEEKEGVAEYARMLEVEEKIGHIEIPKIEEDIPIYAGTRESVLQKGAGHLEGTSLPIGGKASHAVITAHRGLAKVKLFRNLDKLEVGDRFYVHNINTVLCYEVDRILTVEPTDFDPVLIKDEGDYCTLLTCTPYMINSHRLLVRGHRVDYVPPVKENTLADNAVDNSFKDYLYLIVPFLLVVILLTILLIIDNIKTSRKVKELEDEIKKR